MKQHYVTDLQDGQLVLSLFLVREKEIRTSNRTGTSWLHLDLVDRTGTIAAKMWENFTALADTFERDDVVHIRGRVKVYKGEKELTLEQIKPALAPEYDIADFLPHTRHDIGRLYAELRYAIAAMKNPWLQRLLTSVVEDPAIEPRLKRAPAAMTMHHAFIGGLLEHVHSLIGLGRAVAAHYPELDSDLLLTGIVLHDIGKIDELVYVRGVEYTTEGRLLGHIMIGVSLVREKIRAIPDFPAPLATLVEHMILSHHGSHEFGSPSLPQVREAVALHFLDDMDSKMAAMRATLEASAGQPASDLWTDRNPSLRRALLRSDAFLSAKLEPAAKDAAAPAPKPAPLSPPPAAPPAPAAAQPSRPATPSTPPATPAAPVPRVPPGEPVASPSAAPSVSTYATLFTKSENEDRGKFAGASIDVPQSDKTAPEKEPPRSSYASPLFRKTLTADEKDEKPEDKK
jgi:3'-5' exoribonuclease